jgi:hypothetical protein
MQRLFRETPIFTERLKELASDLTLSSIQQAILSDPECGDLVKGTGGVRKLRAADPQRGKGKRGGLRTLFLDLPNREITYLIYLYNKDESEDLTSNEKKQIRELVIILKGEKQ